MYWVANMSLCKFETHLDYIYDRHLPPRIRMRSSRYSEGRFPSKGQSNCLPPYKSLCGDMRPDLTKVPPNSAINRPSETSWKVEAQMPKSNARFPGMKYPFRARW